MASTRSNTSPILTKSGIGGAGNYRALEHASTTRPTIMVVGPNTSGTFTAGIGCAGNTHHASDRSRLPHVESIRRDLTRQYASPTNYHLGLGGVGNIHSRNQSPSRSIASSGTSFTSKASTVAKIKDAALKRWHRRDEQLPPYTTSNSKPPAYQGLFPSSTDKAFSGSRERMYESNESMSSQETLVSKTMNLKERLVWRIRRIDKYGLDEGMAKTVHTYDTLQE